MNVVVLVKWVPNPEGVPELGDDFRLKREGQEGSLDPGDEFGVEAALQVVDAQAGVPHDAAHRERVHGVVARDCEEADAV